MSKRSIVVTLVASLCASIVLLDARPSSALSSVESCFFNAINRERATAGRTRLALKDDLTAIARRHSRRMADDHTIYHNRNLGNEVPGKWWAAGENVGMGPSCRSIHDAFMSSPGHRANIIDRDYNQAGVGVAYDEEDTIYVTEVFAGRRSSTVRKVSRPQPRTRPRTTRPATRSVPRPAPPKPTVVPPAPRTVGIMLLLVGLDARRVDPITGYALGV